MTRWTDQSEFGALNVVLLVLMLFVLFGLLWFDCGPYLAWLIRGALDLI